MLKCPICNKEYDGKNPDKQLHAHMLKSHKAEYDAKGCKLSAFGIKVEKPSVEKPDRPEDFRPLDKSNSMELAAYNQGNRYFSGGYAFTSEECRQRGWM